VWKVNGVRVTTLAGQPALLMPYAHAIKDPSDKDKLDMQNAIREMASLFISQFLFSLKTNIFKPQLFISFLILYFFSTPRRSS
jgi:hypothetical protein